MRSKTFFVLLGTSAVLADQIYVIDDAPSISPTDDLCGLNASKTTCNSFVDWDNLDPALQPMLLPNNKVFYAYVRPDVSSFYKTKIPDEAQRRELREVKPRFNGMAGRFVNMSPDPMLLMWLPGPAQDPLFITYVDSFEKSGTATYPGHRFCMAPIQDEKKCVKMFDVKEGVLRYTYDPFVDDPENYNLSDLTLDQLEKYQRLEIAEDFSRRYKTFTGRDFLSNYPRSRVTHYMYPADYLGQTHTVESDETHFTELPPKELLNAVSNSGSKRKLKPDQPRILNQYRSDAKLNMTLTVLSCAPRVYEIQNFMSDVEVDHILELAGTMSLHESRVGDSEVNLALGDGIEEKLSRSSTRTSKNAWVSRETSPIIDVVYRRAADLLHIDEALLRYRSPDEYPNLGSSLSIAEQLQLVHYEPGQEYTAHHDFGYPLITDRYQPSRFATLLLYLNEVTEGGETSFPRWVNAETSNELKVKPAKGKAVLFYGFLPDGNLDDLSQHAALPVIKGEKWLTNLWVWDPFSGA